MAIKYCAYPLAGALGIEVILWFMMPLLIKYVLAMHIVQIDCHGWIICHSARLPEIQMIFNGWLRN